MDQTGTNERYGSDNASEFLPPQPTRNKKYTENQRLEKTFEILTACSNQTVKHE
jgi:hypothetical protein